MIKGYIFDLDGTLTMTQNLHQQALQHVFSRYGIEYTRAEDQEKYSGKRSKTIFEEVLRAAGKNPTIQEIESCALEKKQYYNQLLEETEIKPVAGLKSFLDDARAAGKKLIVATGNKLEPSKKILERAGVIEYFPEIVTQQDVEHQKPAPDIFLLAAQKMGLHPSECVVFEDALNGVKAAKAGGIKCIGMATGTTAEKLIAAGADSAVADYTDQNLKNLI